MKELKNTLKGLFNRDTLISFYLAWVVAGVSSGVFLAGKQLYDYSSANVVITQSCEETSKRHPTFGSGSSIYGYDTNQDGQIDKIKEYWSWNGAHATALRGRNYLPNDKEFSSLDSLFAQEKYKIK